MIQQYEVQEDGTVITTNLALNDLLNQELRDQNLLFINQKALIEKIKAIAPIYGQISLSRQFPNSLIVKVEKLPQIANITAIISGSDGIRTTKKYLINTEGIITQENDENPDLPYIVIENNQAFELGSRPIKAAALDYILKTINLFEEKFGLRIVEAIYLKTAREIRLRTENGISIWFDMNYSEQSNNMIQQIDKLKRALPKLDIYKNPPEYIDLRIAGTDAEKVIFKPR